MRHREEQLLASQEDLSRQLENRRVDLPSTEEIKAYVADFREFLHQGTFPERKALIRNFVKEIEVVGDQATLTYTIPMPSDGVTKKETSVLYFVNSGLPAITTTAILSFGERRRPRAPVANRGRRLALVRVARGTTIRIGRESKVREVAAARRRSRQTAGARWPGPNLPRPAWRRSCATLCCTTRQRVHLLPRARQGPPNWTKSRSIEQTCPLEQSTRTG